MCNFNDKQNPVNMFTRALMNRIKVYRSVKIGFSFEMDIMNVD